MVEQQFVALLCLAWATPGFRFEALTPRGHGATPDSPDRATSRDHNSSTASELLGSWSAVLVSEERSWNVTLVFQKLDAKWWVLTTSLANSTIAPSLSERIFGSTAGHSRAESETAATVLDGSTALLTGGFHHRVPRPEVLFAFLRRILWAWPQLASVVVSENLYNHFPGGEYLINSYPKATPPMREYVHYLYPNVSSLSTAVCDQWRSPVDTTSASYTKAKLNLGEKPLPPGVSYFESAAYNHEVQRALPHAVRKHQALQRVRLLRLAELYRGRGDAHVEYLEENTGRHSRRDCFHLCVAPGVTDALALATLEAVLAST